MSELYPIIEIFESIQGEGINLGIPATFIRFSGCNLNCDWCDTKNSWEVKEEHYKSINEIIQMIKEELVVITGGEPTLYNLKPLIDSIKSNNNMKSRICIETNGTNLIDDSIGIDWVTCSPKPKSNYSINCTPNELKYVVDENFSIDVIPPKYIHKIPIWLQPNWDVKDKSIKKCYELVMKYNYLRLGVQLHKFYELK